MTALRLPLAFALLACCGCDRGPSAPPLQNEAVFHSPREGLKFVRPDNWMMLARAELPSGRAEQPRMLASYVMAEKQAELEVYRVDLADDTDVARYLTEHPVGPYKWLVAQPPARIEVAGLSATRFTYTRKDKGKEYTREYTACRRGERVYLFVASFLAADLALRDQARQVLRSVSWDK